MPAFCLTVCVTQNGSAGATEPQRRRRRASAPKTAKKPSGGGLLNVMDDMMEKQYGRGKLYYGERQTTEEADDPSEFETLKPEAVLVAGGTGRTGQWVVLGLLNQGFNVRVLTRRFERAEELFGESGANVDVFEGDLSDPKALADAAAGTKAVVFVAGGDRRFFMRSKPPSADALVQAAVDAKVSRFVLIADGVLQSSAEQALASCDLPHVVVRPAPLCDEEGGLRTVLMHHAKEKAPLSTAFISRLDLAQVICQALVHDRFIAELAEGDPDGEHSFPDVTVYAYNGNDELVPDERYWRKLFSSLSRTASPSASSTADRM